MGHAHADLVAAELYGVAARIKRVELPALPDKGDIVDWLAAGNGKDELLAAVKAAPALEQAPDVQADDYNNDNNEGDFFEFVDENYLINMPPVSWAVGEGDTGLITAHGLSMIYGAPER